MSSTKELEKRIKELEREVEEKQAINRELQYSKAVNDIYMDNSILYIYFKDENKVYRSVNKKMADSFGKKPNEIIGKTDFEIFTLEKALEYVKDDERVKKSRKRKEFLYQHKKSDGEIITAIIKKIPIFSSEGKFRGTIGTFHDITYKKKLETMTRGVAHEFNNILQSISGSVGLMRRKAEDVDYLQDKLDLIKKTVMLGKKINEELLVFSGIRCLDLKSIDIRNTLDSFKELNYEKDENDHIDWDIVIKYQPDTWNVRGDEEKLSQIFFNLISNAYDSLRDGANHNILVETKNIELEDGRYVRVSISDTGSGMDEDTKSKIFDPFYTTKNPGEGTGLGLCVCESIITDHSGYIKVESTPGKGTKFDVYLKAELEELIEDMPKEAKATNSRLNARILLVDDDEDIKNCISEILKFDGYGVYCAGDGKEALEMMQENKYDLVIMDKNMPRMSGTEAYFKIRETDKDTKIAFLSGYIGDNEINQICSEDDKTAYLTKPIFGKELTNKINEILISC